MSWIATLGSAISLFVCFSITFCSLGNTTRLRNDRPSQYVGVPPQPISHVPVAALENLVSRRVDASSPAVGRRFDECLNAQDPGTLNDPGFRMVIEDLRRVPAYSKTTWNVNKPYSRRAVNVLIPHWNEEFWPAQSCGGLPREPADCVTSPRENYIICNPAVGRELGSPLIQSRIGSIEEEFGSHFILLTLIGHELGHIQLHSDSNTHHLNRFRGKDGLKCFNRDSSTAPTEEEKADEIGLSIACAALKSRPDRKDLPKDPGGAISLMDRLEGHLDEGYFAMDDLCTGDKDYPSISRRKQHFADQYFACLYSGALDSVRLLNQGLSEDLSDLEKVLLDRQLTGQVGSGNYGRRALGFNSTVATGVRDAYLSYDSTDNDSGLWAVFPDKDGLLQFRQLLAWDRTGKLVSSSMRPDGARTLLIQIEDENEQSGPSAISVIGSCSAEKCTATESQFSLPLGGRLFQGEGRTIAIVSRSGFRVLQSDQAGLNGLAKAPLREHDLNTSPDDLAVGFEGERGIILIARKSGGLYNAAVFDAHHVEWKILLTFPHTAGMLEAATIVDGRLLVSFYETPQIESAESSTLKLWDCPADEILDARESQVQCRSYTAPAQVNVPVALVTHDLSSISDESIEAPGPCQGKLVIHHGGWLWFLDRTGSSSDLLPADGLVGCDEFTNIVTTFRARRLDQFKLRMTPVSISSVSLAIMNASGPPKRSSADLKLSRPAAVCSPTSTDCD